MNCLIVMGGQGFFREPNCIFKSYLKVLCIETSTTFGSLQKFEGAPGEFKGALSSWHPLISNPGGERQNYIGD